MRAILIAMLLLPLSIGGATYARGATAPQDPGGATLPETLAPMLAKVSPAVVNISVQGAMKLQNPFKNNPLFEQFFNLPKGPVTQHFQAVGSGVIYDAQKGYVITNDHVVKNATQIMVTLNDRRELKAKLVADDPKTDIALLKIAPDHLTSLPLGDSKSLHVGDFVVAIGDPFGVGQTATFGIVSALERTGLGIEGYENFIQTDASINPGNSGGALLDMSGQLIGMNTAILSSGGGNVGIGFAIPISMVKEIADQLIAHGKVSRGELGVIIQDLTPGIASAMGLKINSGALVADVMPGSAAAAAGLKSGDVVTALNGQPVHDSAELRNRVGGMQPGTKVQLTVLRDGSQHPVEATLRTETARPSEAAASSGGQAGTEPELGMQLGPIPADTADAGNLQGAYVTAVLPGSAAEDAGIQAGDIITEVAGKTVSSPQEAASLLRNRPKGKPVLIRIRRDQASLFVALG